MYKRVNGHLHGYGGHHGHWGKHGSHGGHWGGRGGGNHGFHGHHLNKGIYFLTIVTWFQLTEI